MVARKIIMLTTARAGGAAVEYDNLSNALTI